MCACSFPRGHFRADTTLRRNTQACAQYHTLEIFPEGLFRVLYEDLYMGPELGTVYGRLDWGFRWWGYWGLYRGPHVRTQKNDSTRELYGRTVQWTIGGGGILKGDSIEDNGSL